MFGGWLLSGVSCLQSGGVCVAVYKVSIDMQEVSQSCGGSSLLANWSSFAIAVFFHTRVICIQLTPVSLATTLSGVPYIFFFDACR